MKSLYTSPYFVSEYIIRYFIEKNKPINNHHLQHILFLIQVETDCKLFSNDFEALTTGPVIPCVYHRYNKRHGYNKIKEYKDYAILPNKIKEMVNNTLFKVEDLSEVDLLNIIIDSKAYCNALDNSKSYKITKASIKNDIEFKEKIKNLNKEKDMIKENTLEERLESFKEAEKENYNVIKDFVTILFSGNKNAIKLSCDENDIYPSRNEVNNIIDFVLELREVKSFYRTKFIHGVVNAYNINIISSFDHYEYIVKTLTAMALILYDENDDVEININPNSLLWMEEGIDGYDKFQTGETGYEHFINYLKHIIKNVKKLS